MDVVIEWASRASLALDEQLEFISENDSRENAGKVAARIFGSLQSLKVFPSIGRVVGSDSDREYREFVIHRVYRLVYRIDGNVLRVVAFINVRDEDKYQEFLSGI